MAFTKTFIADILVALNNGYKKARVFEFKFNVTL